MRLFVQEHSPRPKAVPADEALILVADNWNDYSFTTLFNLYLQSRDGLRELGQVRILRKGQRENEPTMPSVEVAGGAFGEDYVSLGSTLDYYAEVGRLGEIGQKLLGDLRDLSRAPALGDGFADEKGLRVSLHRDKKDVAAFYDEARRTVESGGAPPDPGKLFFNFLAAPGAEPIPFSFGQGDERPFKDVADPLYRVVVVVGPNGVGKTQLLARLARLAYAPPAERGDLAADGVLEDAPAFPSIVAVSYSAFDDFSPPSLRGDDIGKVIEQLRQGTGRYGYCGMRDLPGHLERPGEPRKPCALSRRHNSVPL